MLSPEDVEVAEDALAFITAAVHERFDLLPDRFDTDPRDVLAFMSGVIVGLLRELSSFHPDDTSESLWAAMAVEIIESGHTGG